MVRSFSRRKFFPCALFKKKIHRRRGPSFLLKFPVSQVIWIFITVCATFFRKKLPGRFFELNIHYGLFLGGQGDFSELFLGHHDSLRGCLSQVEYNGVDILKKARERSGVVEVQGVTWTCSPEFEAGADKEMSFVEDGAFFTLVNPISRSGAR